MFEVSIKDEKGTITKDARLFSVEDLMVDLKLELVRYASEVYRDETQSGFPKDAIRRVDNRYNKPISDVKPFGKIEFINTDTDMYDLLVKSYDEIEKRSPVGGESKTVKYKNYNYIYFNDRLVAKNRVSFQAWLHNRTVKGFNRGDKITFINITPYARKLERRGITSKTVGMGNFTKTKKGKGGNLVVRPSGTYAVAQRPISRMMKGRAFVSKTKFVPYNISVNGMGSSFKRANSVAGIGRPYLYPVIDIYPIVNKGVPQ